MCILFAGLFVFVFWWGGGGNSTFIDEFVIKAFAVIVYVVCIWLIRTELTIIHVDRINE